MDWSHGDPGDPLYLTPYIEKGDIDTGTDGSSEYCHNIACTFL